MRACANWIWGCWRSAISTRSAKKKKAGVASWSTAHRTVGYSAGRIDAVSSARRVHAALASCLELPAGSRPLLVSHGIALGCPGEHDIRLPAYAERRLRLRNCSICASTISKARGWLPAGWWKRRATSRILTPPQWTSCSVNGGSGSDTRSATESAWPDPAASIFRVEAFNIQPLATRQVQHRHAGAVDGQDEFPADRYPALHT